MPAPKAVIKLIFMLALVFFICPAVADGDDEPGVLDEKRVDAAVKKAVEYLKGLQNADGSWKGTAAYEGYYPFGTTALALFAVVKGGEPKDSECITRALSHLKGEGFPGVYSTSCLILALVALVEVEEKKDEEPEEDGEKKGLRTEPMPDPDDDAKKKLKNSPAWLKDWIRRAVGYLIKNQAKSVWRYPGTNPGETGGTSGVGGDQDCSATQFVMMALFAARRIGITPPKAIYPRVAEFYMLNQEDKGPEVESFPIPGADLDLSKVKDMEKKWRKEFNRQLKEEKKRAKKEKKESGGVEPKTIPREANITNRSLRNS
ncbi:MAG: hypothetical protein ACYS8W_08330 [Planctomycetota bacterium]|jgi:hypothetical protein